VGPDASTADACSNAHVKLQHSTVESGDTAGENRAMDCPRDIKPDGYEVHYRPEQDGNITIPHERKTGDS
jgi:hypothetical protein